MFKTILITLPLLAASALANSMPPTEGMPPAEAPAPAPQTPPEYDFSEERALYHNPLNAILAFVHDRATADAAAPRVKALLATPAGAELKVTPDIWLFLYFGSSCYGSTELMDALRSKLPEGNARVEQYRTTLLPFMDELGARLDSLSAALEQVQDAASAEQAAAELNALPSFMADWGKRADAATAQALPNTEFSRDEMYAVLAVQQIYPIPALDRLRHAYGHAQSRQKGGFPPLAEAYLKACAPLSYLTGYPCAENTTPEQLARSERLAEDLREWMTVAATITDKASADAAADWLARKNAQRGSSLITAGRERLENEDECACLAVLCALLENMHCYLGWATPTCFGSEKLENLLRARPEEAMPLPEVKPLPKPEAE